MKNLNLLISFLCLTVYSQAQVYVDLSSLGSNDGTSWTNAFTDIEEALDQAPKGSDIWIAQGDYHPKATLNLNEKDFDIYGSFQGDESHPSERTFRSRTVISGDVNDDDVFGDYYTNDSDNLKHVLFIIESNPMTIDGIVVEGGRGDQEGTFATQSALGGGVYCNGKIHFENCTVRNNRARYGAGIYLVHTLSIPGDYTFKNCKIEGNEGRAACGVYAGFGGTNVEFTNVSFIKNNGFEGGALLVAGATVITNAKFTDCLFDGNSAVFAGAVEVEGFGIAHFENSDFKNNTASRGGAVHINSSGIASFSNCTWEDNSAIESETEPGLGGAIYIEESSRLTIREGLFSRNSGEDAAGAIMSLNFYEQSNVIEVTNSLFVENYSDYGNGGAIQSQGLTSLNITSSLFADNEGNEGGAIFTNGGTTTICKDCEFYANYAGYGGAILVNEYDDNITIEQSIFSENFSFVDGGAFYNYRGAKTRFSECIFEFNESLGWGGAVYTLGQGSPELSIYGACEFRSNKSDFSAGAVYSANMNLFILNSLFHDNEALEGGFGNAISSNQSSSVNNKVVLVNNTFHENADGLGAIT